MILVKGTRIPFRRAVSVQSALEKGSPSSPIIISFRPATPFPGFRSTSLERRKSFLKNLQKLLHDISSVDRTSKIDLGIFRCSSTGPSRWIRGRMIDRGGLIKNGHRLSEFVYAEDKVSF